MFALYSILSKAEKLVLRLKIPRTTTFHRGAGALVPRLRTHWPLCLARYYPTWRARLLYLSTIASALFKHSVPL